MHEITFLWTLLKETSPVAGFTVITMFLWQLNRMIRDIKVNDLAHLYEEIRELRATLIAHLDKENRS